jgi:hypothetical protein
VLTVAALALLCGGCFCPSQAGDSGNGPSDSGSASSDGASSSDAAATDGGTSDAAVADSGPGPSDGGASDSGAFSDSGTLATEPFTDTYQGWNAGTNSIEEYAMLGAEPVAPGAYPVFIYTVGTFGTHDTASAIPWIEEMAARGFVAASVEYSNGPLFGCPAMYEKAGGIYSDADSAIAMLCGRPKADCSKGIVTAGHSQGSMMAMLAADFDARVRATLALGTGYSLLGFIANHEQCLVTDRVLPDDRLRATNGESDGSFGALDTMVDQLNDLTAMGCEAADITCLRPNGSGWVLVQDSDVLDGEADHCFMGNLPPGSTASGCTVAPDDGWLTTAEPWGRAAGASFLESFVDP